MRKKIKINSRALQYTADKIDKAESPAWERTAWCVTTITSYVLWNPMGDKDELQRIYRLPALISKNSAVYIHIRCGRGSFKFFAVEEGSDDYKI